LIVRSMGSGRDAASVPAQPSWPRSSCDDVLSRIGVGRYKSDDENVVPIDP
jgi:hypothetical protein